MLTVKNIENIKGYRFEIADGVHMELSYIHPYIDDRYIFELIFADDNKGVRTQFDIEIYRQTSALKLIPARPCHMMYVKKSHSFITESYVVNAGHLNSIRKIHHTLFTLVYNEYAYNREYRELCPKEL